MAGTSSLGIFLNYRRQDAAPYARLLQMELRERLPEAPVFLDLDSIEAGRDFADVIRDAVDSCAVLVALIGRQWATLTDEDGQRRLDNPDDYVRFEIQTALERGVRVIPVLVDGAGPPKQQQLPSDLRKLARLNALELSYGRYQYDADRLFDLIRQVLAEAARTSAQLAEVAEVLTATDPDRAERIAQTDSEPGQDSRPRQVRIFEKALAAAQSIGRGSEKWKSLALARLAGVAAATDPDRADRLLDDAERIAQSIEYEDSKADTLAHLAGMVAATDPDRAERLAIAAERAIQSIRDVLKKRNYLVDLAGVLATVDPGLAERAAQSIHDEGSAEYALARSLARTMGTADYDPVQAERMADEQAKEQALAQIAGTVAGTDPDRAERIAESISTFIGIRETALASIVKAIAGTDPDRAERIAGSITTGYKEVALASIAEAVVGFDPERAERISQLIVENMPNGSEAMGLIAEAMAAVDPDRAESIAEQIEAKQNPGKFYKARALRRIARRVANGDPERAERIAETIVDDDAKAYALASIAEAVVGFDPERAERISQLIVENYANESPAMELVAGVMGPVDPDRAESIVEQITNKPSKDMALTRIATAIATVDPDRAERIAESITYDIEKARALAGVSEAIAAADHNSDVSAS